LWEWAFRLGVDYSDEWEGNPTGPGVISPVNWIVVAKDHYEMNEGHVTLLSEKLIGLFAFDNCGERGYQNEPDKNILIFGYGHNHWGESGTITAINGLRPWLDSTDIHSGEGF